MPLKHYFVSTNTIITITAAALFLCGYFPSTAIAMSPRATYKTTAEALYQAYETNEVATDQKIGNAIVEISGTIYSIDKDFTNRVIIVFETSNEFSSASMRLLKSEDTLAARLRKGQNITLRCDRVSRLLGSPTGQDCKIMTGAP